MSEEKQLSKLSPRSFEGTMETRAFIVGHIDQEHRLSNFKWLMPVMAIIGIASIIFYIPIYVQANKPWQILTGALGLIPAILCLIPARRLVRRGKLDAAGYWILFGLTVAYGEAELWWAGVTWYLLVGGIAIIFIAGNLFLPGRWTALWAAVGAFVVYMGLVNWFEPFERYDIAQLPVLQNYVMGITILLTLMFAWQIIRTLRIGNIRTRLLLASVFMVLLTAVAISVVSVVGGLQSGRQQAVSQLESVAKIKESEINGWLDRLQADLNATLSSYQAMPRILWMLQAPGRSKSTELWVGDHFQQAIGQTPRVEHLSLLNLEGRVIFSSDVTQKDRDYSDQPYFQAGLKGFYLQPPVYSPALERVSMVAARPVLDIDGQVAGVLVGLANPATLSEIMGERAWLGDTGEIYLIDRNRIPLTALRFDDNPDQIHTEGANTALETEGNGSIFYDDYRGEPVIGVYHWLPELRVALVAKQDQAEALSITISVMQVIGYVVAGVLVIAISASLFITRGITRPLANLTETAMRVSAGDLSLTAQVEREDEIGKLAQVFNYMTGQLHELVDSLEQRVADRTQRLEIVAGLGEQLSAILNLDELLVEVVNQTKAGFGYYHTQIYLLDDKQETLVLAAGAGKAGIEMKARGHHIPLNVLTSPVVDAAHTGQVITVDDLRQTEGWLPHPLLPDTYSQMAVPIILGGQVVGVLEVQEDKVTGLDASDAALLRSLANQVAVAIRNARLFAEVETALQEARATQERYLEQSWQKAKIARRVGQSHYARYGASTLAESTLIEAKHQAQTQNQPAIVTLNGDSPTPKSNQEDPNNPKPVLSAAEVSKIQNPKSIVAPITLRDTTIGTLQIHSVGDDQIWTEDDLAIIETLVTQLAQAAENLRLFDDTRERANREQTIREITDKLRAAPTLERLVEIATEELGRRFSAVHAELELGLETDSS